jgi:hypothetical protein
MKMAPYVRSMIMQKTLLPFFCGVLLWAPAASATQAYYEVYAAGVNVIVLDTEFSVEPTKYVIHLNFHTVGAFSLVMRSRQHTVVEGQFVGDRPMPLRFFSTGMLRGNPRVTQLDYHDGQPVIRQLVPPSETERELVAPADQANTVDTLSAMAELVRQVNTTGRCEGRLSTFDGRRLIVLEARTSGLQVLEPTGRSSFAGQALRCDFIGRQLGGFKLDEDRERLQRPQQGTAWFAAVTPDGPKIPVRVVFRTRWFGDATMYLTKPPSD